MFGATAVKLIAIAEKSNPPKKAINGNSRKNGEETRGIAVKKLAAPITRNTIVALMVERVAPQSNSPATTSSTLTGVAIIASNVFW